MEGGGGRKGGHYTREGIFVLQSSRTGPRHAFTRGRKRAQPELGVATLHLALEAEQLLRGRPQCLGLSRGTYTCTGARASVHQGALCRGPRTCAVRHVVQWDA
jgi:hypothetical protein